MFKFIAFLAGGDADAAADTSAERPSLPSASTDPSAAADQRKDEVRKTSNERNETSPRRRDTAPSSVAARSAAANGGLLD
ncbi:hypothetical protein THAOC_32643, partial [Thalassiosira oceanica]